MNGNQRQASDAHKAAVDALQKFYSLIVALAFTGSVLKFIQLFDFSNLGKEQFQIIFVFLAFISTIVPFYHGMERHLYETHVARGYINWKSGGRPSPLLFDVFAFLIEGGLLLSMGRNIDNPEIFLKLWSALLIVDIIWIFFVFNIQKQNKPIWLANNFAFVLLAWICWEKIPYLFDFMGLEASWAKFSMVGAIVVIEIARSIVDYVYHRDFYFPDGFYG